MQKKRKAGRIIALSVVGIMLIGAGVYFVPKLLATSSAANTTTQVLTAEATKGEIVSSLSATGTVAESTQDVDIPYGAAVSSLSVSAGETVAKGDAIAKLDTYSVAELISDAKSLLSDVNDELDAIADADTETEYIYSKFSGVIKDVFVAVGNKAADITAKKGSLLTITLTDGGVFKVVANEGTVAKLYVSKGDTVYSGTTLLKLTLPVATTSKATLEAKRNTLIADIETLTAAGTSGIVYAPCAGTVGTINAAAGDSISNKDGDTDILGALTQITLPDKMSLSVTIDELDVSTVKAGQEASISLDAIEGKTFAGKVTEVSDSAGSDSSTPKYTAILSLDKAEGMYLGMSATATIVKEKKEGVITLPLEALGESGSGMFVYTSTDESGNPADSVTVETGLSNGAAVEITSGITEGTTVYYVASSDETTSTFGNRGMVGFGGDGGMRTLTDTGKPPQGSAPGEAPSGGNQ